MTTKLSKAVKLFGTDEPKSKLRELTAGDLTAAFDSGSLRYIRYRGVEVLRGISYLVRNKDWGTTGATISRLKLKQSKAGFTISYHAECKDASQELHYDARIEGSAHQIKFSATGLPITDVLTNRTGFVVLHPLDGIVGAPVKIVHTDGSAETSTFPRVISPGQPVFDIRSLKHTVMPGVTATVLMEGNKFEMEDHRNWMDASYKTYVCSLLDPWPYTLPKGKPFEQSITVTLEGKPKAKGRAAQDGVTEVSIGKAKGRIPRIGAGVPMNEAAVALAAADAIKDLNLSTLVCQIDGREDGQAAAARAFAELSRAAGVPVKLEIILPARSPAVDEMRDIADAVRAGGLSPASVVVTQKHDLKSFQPNTPRPWGPTYEEMAAAARQAFPGIAVGGGMLSYFTELNRKPVPSGLFDFVTHSVCPIVHAADDISVMETLEALPSIFASVRKMIDAVPYHLGPSSIPCRDNPYGAAVSPNPHNKRVCLAAADPRQRGLFAAAWNIGLAAAASRDQLDEIALGSVTGPQGLIDAGVLHPAFHSVAAVAALRGQKQLTTSSSRPSTVAALAAASAGGTVLLLANLTDHDQHVKLGGLGKNARMQMLAATTFTKAARDRKFLQGPGEALGKARTVALPAYAVARVTSS